MLLTLVLIACGASEPTPVAEAPAAPEAVVPEAAAPEAAVAAATPEGWSSFGTAFTANDVIPAAQLLKDSASFTGKTVRVEGRVADVCSKKGCWMVLTAPEGGQEMMRVTMKDHAWGLPLDCTGQAIQLEGEVVAKAVDPETVEHYKSEARKPELTPETQATAGMSYELVASGARLKPVSPG
jgi:hypothetical protein